MCYPNGLLFHQKSFDMGSILGKKCNVRNFRWVLFGMSPDVQAFKFLIFTSCLKGVLHLLPKITMFCALSQNNQQLFEK